MKITTIIAILAIVTLQSCCVSHTYKLNEDFTVELEKEGIGGYQWYYIAIPEVVAIDSTKLNIIVKGQLTQYTKKFTLRGVETGKYNLVFHHLRSFEKFDTVPQEHIKTIKVKINN